MLLFARLSLTAKLMEEVRVLKKEKSLQFANHNHSGSSRGNLKSSGSSRKLKASARDNTAIEALSPEEDELSQAI